MPGRIPQSFIDDLLNRTDIIDVIDAYVPLKKAGSNFKACCPFHNEKTPSFTVSQPKQFYHCFGCGAHGTAISFLMEYEHLEFVEAIEELARQAGIDVVREQGSVSTQPRQDNLYAVMSQAHAFYRQQLRSHPQADKAIAYLKNRGMSGEIAAEFGIGFAPPGWDNLINALGNDAHSLAQLNQVGLTIEQDNKKPYDRFRDRIMIPITDRRGRVIAFGGRVLSADDQGAKYLNSPETAIFHKSNELYGLYEARKALRNLDKLLIVEGYMDVLALAQFGIRYAVATLGTATTNEHLQTLFRVVPKLIFCFDGDRAGRDAAWRALTNALPVMQEGREAAFLFLPEGEDPDSLVHHEGKEAFEARLEQAMPLSRFLLEHLAEQVDLSSEDGRARLVALAKPHLNRVPDKVFRHLLFDHLAELVNIDTQQLKNLAEQAPKQPRTTFNTPIKKGQKKKSPVRQAINLILQHPAAAGSIDNFQFLTKLELPGAQLLFELLEILSVDPHLNTAALLERWRDRPEEVHLLKLAESHLPGDEQTLEMELKDTLAYLGSLINSQRWQFLQQKLVTNGLDEHELNEWNQLLKDNSTSKGN
jgi:DNA primase